MHINCHTASSSAHLVSLEQLSGGTVKDYTQHICERISNLIEIYALSTSTSVAEAKKKKQKTLKALIGILFLIGLTKRSSFELYWSTGDFIQIPNLKT